MCCRNQQEYPSRKTRQDCYSDFKFLKKDLKNLASSPKGNPQQLHSLWQTIQKKR
jgi:hypothetical protein